MPRNRNRNRNRNRTRTTQRVQEIDESRRPKYTQSADVIDYLSEDEVIDSQRYCCVSFASVTDNMRDEFIEAISSKLSQPTEIVRGVVERWCELEHPKRAVKVRGSAGTIDEIQRRAEKVRERDNNFHVFACEVGKWLAFDPNPDIIQDENYMEQQLNELVKGYKQNKEKTKTFFEQRRREMMEKAIAEGTPEIQEAKLKEEEPIEAVEYRIKQSEEYISDLLDKIEEHKKTIELSKTKLEYLKENPSVEDTKDVPPPSKGTIFEMPIEDKNDAPKITEIDTHKIDQLREMDKSAKQAELGDLAKELVTQSQRPVRTEQNSELFEDEVLIPSQIRYNYEETK
jgi:hypothetical protein